MSFIINPYLYSNNDNFQLLNTTTVSSYSVSYIDANFVYIGTSSSLSTYTYSGDTLTLVDSVAHSSTKYQIYASNGYVYVAGYTDGVLLFSVDGSGNLAYLGSHNTSNGTYWGVTEYDGVIFCSAQLNSRGIQKYIITNDALVYQGQTSFSGSGRNLINDGNYLYVAYSTGGYLVYSLDGGINLTLKNAADAGGTYGYVTKYNDNVIFTNGYLLNYTNSSGVLTLQDTYTDEVAMIPAANTNYIFCVMRDALNDYYLSNFTLSSQNFVLEKNQAVPNITSQVHYTSAYGDYIVVNYDSMYFSLYKYKE